MSETETGFWEPWSVAPEEHYLRVGVSIPLLDNAGASLPVTCRDRETAERIVACVNACVGAASVDLIAGFVEELMVGREEAQALIDCLRAANAQLTRKNADQIAANDVLNSQLISAEAESGRLREALEAAREETK